MYFTFGSLRLIEQSPVFRGGTPRSQGSTGPRHKGRSHDVTYELRSDWESTWHSEESHTNSGVHKTKGGRGERRNGGEQGGKRILCQKPVDHGRQEDEVLVGRTDGRTLRGRGDRVVKGKGEGCTPATDKVPRHRRRKKQVGNEPSTLHFRPQGLTDSCRSKMRVQLRVLRTRRDWG